jgi:hypothetical protein
MALPPAFLWMLGALGVAALAKKVALDAKKAKAEREKEIESQKPTSVPTLERDPKSGVYRPPRE